MRSRACVHVHINAGELPLWRPENRQPQGLKLRGQPLFFFFFSETRSLTGLEFTRQSNWLGISVSPVLGSLQAYTTHWLF